MVNRTLFMRSVLALVALLTISSSFAQQARAASVLEPGQFLAIGQSLESPNGQYRLDMEGGLLAIHAGEREIWNGENADAETLFMQLNGDLVAYAPYFATDVWRSRTDFYADEGVYAALENDGRLVLYTEDGTEIFAVGGDPGVGGGQRSVLGPGDTLGVGESLYSQDGGYRLTMQDDGNLVIYDTSRNQSVWDTCTYNTDARVLVMQGDGNLVLYSPVPPGEDEFRIPVEWSSKTDGYPGVGVSAVLQNDGNFVLYVPGDIENPPWDAWSDRCRKLGGGPGGGELVENSWGLLQLPDEGWGYDTYFPRMYRWGTPTMVYGLINAAGDRYDADSALPRIGIGDLSISSGALFPAGSGSSNCSGYYRRHCSHTEGRFADIVLVERGNPSEGEETRSLTYGDANYSQDRTISWIYNMIDTFDGSLNQVLFNDPEVIKKIVIVTRCCNGDRSHDDHMHIRLAP